MTNFCFIAAPESEWNNLLINHLSGGKGDISPDELYAVIKKRRERTLIRTVCTLTPLNLVFHFKISSIKLVTFQKKKIYFLSKCPQEGGSYQQRVLIEFLKGIQSRTEEITQVLQGKP